MTKLDQMKALWAAGDRRNALRMAASWPMLGEHKDAIQRGWAATVNPGFYRQLGKDPEVVQKAGLEALAERYGLEL